MNFPDEENEDGSAAETAQDANLSQSLQDEAASAGSFAVDTVPIPDPKKTVK